MRARATGPMRSAGSRRRSRGERRQRIAFATGLREVYWKTVIQGRRPANRGARRASGGGGGFTAVGCARCLLESESGQHSALCRVQLFKRLVDDEHGVYRGLTSGQLSRAGGCLMCGALGAGGACGVVCEWVDRLRVVRLQRLVCSEVSER